MKACEFGFNFAKSFDAEVILLHVYFTPIYASSLPYGDVFNYQISDEETVKNVLHKVHDDLNTLSEKIKQKLHLESFLMSNIRVSCAKVSRKKKYSDIIRTSSQNHYNGYSR